MKKTLLLFAFCILLAAYSKATTRTASVSGNWSSTSTWGGTVPLANDDVVINSGITVTIDINPVNINNVTISGTLQFDATGTGRTWTINQNLTINSGGTFQCATPGTSTTHTLNYNGTSVTNNGTFNMVNGKNVCNVVISGSSTQTIGGSNALAFNKLTLNNTGGKFQIDYASGSFTPSEVNPTKLNVSISTNDSLVIRQGLLIGCSVNNAAISHSFSQFKMGGSGSKITSSVNILTQVTTITVNTGMILNDATNSNVTMTVNGTFMSPTMSQADAATAFGVLGPNCQGGASNATSLSIGSDWTMTNIFVFVGNTKIFGGTEPINPTITCSGNISWASSQSHTIDLPFTSNDFYIKTCFFGLFDSIGAFPEMVLNGGSTSSPNTFNVAFGVFDAPVQTSSPLGNLTIAQISESMADWTVSGNWKIVSGASLAVHSDNTLAINGTLRVVSGGEIAGSETETDSTGYIPTNGPKLTIGTNGILSIENLTGLGKGLLSDSNLDVAIKNRTADRNWDLSMLAASGTISYEVNSQKVTDGTYDNVSLSAGTKTLTDKLTINGVLSIASSTIFTDGGYLVSAKGSVNNDGTHSGSGKISLSGSSNQSLSGAGADWGNVELNNSAGATCNNNLSSSGTFTLTNGILSTSSSAKLILTSSGNFSGGSTTSYVNGPVSKTTTSASEFIFPVGKGGTFRQISITPSVSASTMWTAEYYNSAYSNTTSVTAPITSVSHVEYWQLDRNSGTAKGKVKLFWGATSGLNDTLGLRVGRWTGTSWSNAGRTAATGTVLAGTVTSAQAAAFGPFTLAEANSITTNAISGSPFCPEVSLNVPFSSSGTFTAGNIYTAQLSNSTGGFNNPKNIGTLSSTANSGTIPAVLPSNSGSGTGFRIRVVSSNPPVTGAGNTTNLTITACGAPGGLNTTAITQTAATVSWNSVSCAAKYKLQYRKQGTTAFTSKTITATSFNITGLVSNTPYEWKVQTFCTASGSTKSGFTALQSFTTSMKLSENLTSSVSEMKLNPNPASDLVSISISARENHPATVLVFNAMGQQMMQQSFELQEGSNEFPLNISSLTSGIYFVKVIGGNENFMEKLVKE